MSDPNKSGVAYWKATLKLIMTCLVVWFIASFGLGILLVEPMNSIQIAGFHMGFWFAQQGSIYVFLVLIFYYAWKMNKLDEEFDVQED
ncbi:MAG: DUF4212 domain-containing protein [Rhodospirillum sp.]|nr:DUF4212 domain-containing protein [Rhodospirillum sp.]MCF8489535.1 DUF4212 domain-containing protein [Rhodospirillum sp.]MCF8502046.1 DUF4212 domain-containing protein [Rhodospirillum sp.]